MPGPRLGNGDTRATGFATSDAQKSSPTAERAPDNNRQPEERKKDPMKSHPYANNTPDEPAALLTSALVLALFGVLSAIEATGWIMTSTLFILATAAGIGGLVVRYARRIEGVRASTTSHICRPHQPDHQHHQAHTRHKSPQATVVGTAGGVLSSQTAPVRGSGHQARRRDTRARGNPR